MAEHPSEAVAIAMLTSHNNVHQQGTAQNPAKQRLPKIDHPELKQDVNDEEWQSFKMEWRRFKQCTAMLPDEVADQLFQCCEFIVEAAAQREPYDNRSRGASFDGGDKKDGGAARCHFRPSHESIFEEAGSRADVP